MAKQEGGREAAKPLSGAELKAARERAGLTQKEVADLLGIDTATISRWERGASPLSEGKLARLREIYGGNGHVPAVRNRSTAAEDRVPAVALGLPKEVRVWMHEFLLDLARADVSEREIEEARAVLTSPENATWWKDSTPKEMLTAVESFADIIREILRRRGYKLKAAK